MIIEICTDSVEGVLAAQAGGAQRVELCANLTEGGTTPSLGAIRLARKKSNLRLHVLIRPRAGDFLNSDIEWETIKEDILAAQSAGADGVVIGLLLPDGQIDVERTRALVEVARPLSVTFHRAFDLTRDPYEALEAVIATGADRILTSGQAATAIEGLPVIQELVKRAAGRIGILPGSGINETNLPILAQKSGATEFHFSAGGMVSSQMIYHRPDVAMGKSGSSEYTWKATSAERVRQIIQSL